MGFADASSATPAGISAAALATQAATWRSCAPANDTFVWDPATGATPSRGQAETDPRALRCRRCHGMVGVTGLAADVLDGGPGNNVLIQD